MDGSIDGDRGITLGVRGVIGQSVAADRAGIDCAGTKYGPGCVPVIRDGCPRIGVSSHPP